MAQYVPPNSMADIALQRMAEITRERDRRPSIDAQEMAEREAAARAYFGEDERHFVDYAEECVRTSRNSMTNIRRMQRECWEVYQESEPPNYAEKEDWQSRVILPKPHAAVQFAKTQVRKAFTPEFLSIDNEPNKAAGELWKEIMKRQLDRTHANFRIKFPDATEMALAIGTSMEMIPRWDHERGLQYDLIEPWKIHRDPDAISRDSQSGMYWIHEEFQDLWMLLEAEKSGTYTNILAAKESIVGEHNPQNEEMDPERAAELKKHVLTRNKFRSMCLVREFWGVIPDRRGEMLLPKHTFTTCGRKVVSIGHTDPDTGLVLPGPLPSPYPTLRWPGVAFSPLPHLLRFDGRGIVQGVRSLWYWMCSLMALHSDNLNWVVNPMIEVNIQGLIDQSDVDIIPGKVWGTKDTMSGQQVVRTVDRRFITNEILANEQYGDQAFQTGTFVTNTVQGLPGWRNDITFREVAQQLDQSRDMFSNLGENIEDGALHAIRAGMETCMANMTMDDLGKIFAPEKLTELMKNIQSSQGPATQMYAGGPSQLPLPMLTGTFSVSGLTSVLKNIDVVKSIREVLLPLAEHPLFAPYIEPYAILHSVETRLDLRDEGIIADPKEAEQIRQQQKQASAQAQQIQQALVEAQMAAEQQRLQLEAEKNELEAAKLALEAEKMQVEQEIQEVEAVVEMERLTAEREKIAQEIRAKEIDIQRTAVEIGRTIMQAEQIREKLRLDNERLALQARQATAQLAIQAAQTAANIQNQREQTAIARKAANNAERNGNGARTRD